MSMADMIDERLVSFGLDVTNKEDAIRKICKMMYDAGKVSSYEDYLQGVKDRELEFETGMGNGIAIPHCKGSCVKEAAFTLVKNGDLLMENLLIMLLCWRHQTQQITYT